MSEGTVGHVVRMNREIVESFMGDPVAMLRDIAAHIEAKPYAGYEVASVRVDADELADMGGALALITGHRAEVEWKWVGGSEMAEDNE